MSTITINLPKDVDTQPVKLLIATTLFEKGIFSSGQAAELIGISRKQFLEELGKNGVSIFGETAEDIENLGQIEI